MKNIRIQKAIEIAEMYRIIWLFVNRRYNIYKYNVCIDIKTNIVS